MAPPSVPRRPRDRVVLSQDAEAVDLGPVKAKPETLFARLREAAPLVREGLAALDMPAYAKSSPHRRPPRHSGCTPPEGGAAHAPTERSGSSGAGSDHGMRLDRSSAAPSGRPPSPWRLGGLSVRQLCGRVWENFWEDEVLDRAAALSYYLLFALFPALLFLTALLGLVPLPNLMEALMGYLARVLPGDAASLIQRTLVEVTQDHRQGLLSLGAAVALWSASAGMVSVMTALNIAYEVTEARPWWKRRLVAMGLTLGFVAFLVGSLTLMVFGSKLGEALAVWLGFGELFAVAWTITSVPLAAVFVLTGIALVYHLAPAVRQQWRWVTPGSVLAVALWLLASTGLRLYVRLNSYSATYGSIGGVILLLLWLYAMGIVLLVGAHVNAEIENAAAGRGSPSAKHKGERAA